MNILSTEPFGYPSLKLIGGGGVPFLIIQFGESEVIENRLGELERILSNRNYGYDEVVAGDPAILMIW